jgi:hypothetical protein
MIKEGSMDHIAGMIARLKRMMDGALEAASEDPERFQTLVKEFLKAETVLLEKVSTDNQTRAKLRPPVVAESIVVHSMAWAAASMAASAADLGFQLPTQEEKRTAFESICRINVALYMSLINKAMEVALADVDTMDRCIADYEAPKDKGKIH